MPFLRCDSKVVQIIKIHKYHLKCLSLHLILSQTYDAALDLIMMYGHHRRSNVQSMFIPVIDRVWLLQSLMLSDFISTVVSVDQIADLAHITIHLEKHTAYVGRGKKQWSQYSLDFWLFYRVKYKRFICMQWTMHLSTR